MIPRPPRSAILLALALAGCSDLLGFPDDQLAGTSAGGTGGSITACEPGTTTPCYSGDPATKDVGACRGGVHICKADGTGFADECVGEVLPEAEDCATPGDEDCDGLVGGADPDCVCTPGESIPCYDGPPGTEGLGLCVAGTRTCDATGMVYGACAGEVRPVFEACDTPVDEDCDGIVTCAGAHRWTRQLGDASDQEATAVAVDAAGKVFVTGYASGVADFGGGPVGGGGQPAAFVLALDAQGNHLWSKGFGGNGKPEHGYGVAVDTQGGVVVVGDTAGDIDFGSGSQTNNGGYDIFVAKLDSTGNLVFGKLYGGATDQTAWSVATGSADEIVVAGQFADTIDFGCAGGPMTSAGSVDAFVAKLDSMGNCVWQKRYGDTLAQYIYSVAVGPAGNVAITGQFAGTIDFGGAFMFTDPGAGNLFVARLVGSTGATSWAVGAGDAGSQRGDAVVIDGAGNLYVTGYFAGNLDLGGGAPGTSVGGQDMLLAKLDGNTGALIYAKKFGDAANQYAEAIAVDAADDVMVVGNIAGTIDFGGGPLTSVGSLDSVAAKFDSLGNLLWSRRLGGLGDQTTFGVAVDPLGSLAVVVNNNGTIDFGGGAQTSAGSGDIEVVKLAP